jgi:hypothetical protein
MAWVLADMPDGELPATYQLCEIEGDGGRCGVCQDRATVWIKPPNGAILAWCAPCVDRLRRADIKGGQGHLWPAAHR